jgi:hypothetical protein
MRSSMSRSRYMFTALAPPAMRYPPIRTTSTNSQLGVPATNIGATVVTRRSEMILGFVSAIRSAIRARMPALGIAASLI